LKAPAFGSGASTLPQLLKTVEKRAEGGERPAK